MELVVAGAVTGVIGTLSMDALNYLFARAGMVTKIDVAMIGRMTVGWTQGRFLYDQPSEMKRVANEKIIGVVAHYSIGIVLAVPFVVAWNLRFGGPPSSLWVVAYGVATTVASWFFVYPSMGLGILGLRSADGLKNSLSSLANHLFYGVGMAVGIALG
jgi:hypothetical protein